MQSESQKAAGEESKINQRLFCGPFCRKFYVKGEEDYEKKQSGDF